MLRGRKKRVVGRRLQRVVVGDVVDVRIGACVMALVCLARLGGVVPAHVIRERRQARRIVWDLAGIGAAVISELGASRVAASVNLTMGRVSSMGGVVPARVIRKRRQARRVVCDVAGIGAAVISELGASRVAASVSLTMGCVSSMGGVIPARVIRERRQARRIVWDLAGIGAAVISELGASRFDSVNSTTAWVSSIGLSR